MNIGLILSGGTGTRLGGPIPKQYIEVGGRPIISYVIELFESHPQIDKVQIVADQQWHTFLQDLAGKKFAGFSAPGENRQLSILNGLRDIDEYAEASDNVVIHDAARPLVSAETVSDLLGQLALHEAVTPVLPMKDTIYVCENGRFVDTAKREALFAGQTPEAFKLGKYLEATEALLPERIKIVTGSLQVAIMAGMDAVSIPGDEMNFKITTAADLERFQKVLLDRDI